MLPLPTPPPLPESSQDLFQSYTQRAPVKPPRLFSPGVSFAVVFSGHNVFKQLPSGNTVTMEERVRGGEVYWPTLASSRQ